MPNLCHVFDWLQVLVLGLEARVLVNITAVSWSLSSFITFSLLTKCYDRRRLFAFHAEFLLKKNFSFYQAYSSCSFIENFVVILFRSAEEDITFPPTYRFQKMTRDRYAWEKIKATGVSESIQSNCSFIECNLF